MPDQILPESTPAVSMVNLPTGKPLTASEASGILKATGAPVILLAGAPGSGKTTLLASLHDSFQRAPFAEYLAAGSQTLIGFEERCFDSRITSGLDSPATQRTTFDEGQLIYHMRLRDLDARGPFKNILFADMSGEHYERAIDSAADALLLGPMVKRADSFVLLVDAAKLADGETRAHTRSSVSMLLRRFFELRMLEADCRLDILLTKWDIVLMRGGETLCTEIRDSAGTFLKRLCQEHIHEVRVIPIAARPHYKSSLPLAYGLDTPFRSWVERRARQLVANPTQMRLPQLDAPFDRFVLWESEDRAEVHANGN